MIAGLVGILKQSDVLILRFWHIWFYSHISWARMIFRIIGRSRRPSSHLWSRELGCRSWKHLTLLSRHSGSSIPARCIHCNKTIYASKVIINYHGSRQKKYHGKMIGVTCAHLIKSVSLIAGWTFSLLYLITPVFLLLQICKKDHEGRSCRLSWLMYDNCLE